MRRMPRGAVGVLLGIGIIVPALWASAQAINPRPRGQPGQVTILDVAPDTTPSNSLDARDGELHLPIDGLRSPNDERPKPDSEAPRGNSSQTLTAPQLPLKWGRPSESWETQVKRLEMVHMPPPPSEKSRNQPIAPSRAGEPALAPLAKLPTLVEPKKPHQSAVDESASAHLPQVKLPTPVEPRKPHQLAAESKPSRGKVGPHPNFAETQTAQTPDTTGRHLGSSEQSEPKVIATSEDKQAPRMPLTPLQSARHWPPAYVMGPMDGKGRLGLIDIAEDAPPSIALADSRPIETANLQGGVKSPGGWRGRDALVVAWPPAYVTGPPAGDGRLGVIHLDEAPSPAPTAASRPIAVADLQRRIKSLCGQQARDVQVVAQSDGTVLVKVKAVTTSVESQLSRKIFAIPDMTSPKVRLMMEVGP